MTLSSLDYWRLSDELSIVDAAILITDNNPESCYWDDEGNKVQKTFQHDGYEAAFKALRNAVFSNKLPAKFGIPMRPPVILGDHIDGPYGELMADRGETKVDFDTLLRVARNGYFSLTNQSSEPLKKGEAIYVVTEPNWEETTIQVDDLKRWLEGRGVFPPFFFPQGRIEGFRDKAHPRYSPKLACAVAAWETVKTPARNKTAKETVVEWVQSNGATFGMAEGNGIVPKQAVEDVSKVVNWNTRGGAAPTYQGEPENEPKPVQNYQHVDEFDEDIPF